MFNPTQHEIAKILETSSVRNLDTFLDIEMKVANNNSNMLHLANYFLNSFRFRDYINIPKEKAYFDFDTFLSICKSYVDNGNQFSEYVLIEIFDKINNNIDKFYRAIKTNHLSFTLNLEDNDSFENIVRMIVFTFNKSNIKKIFFELSLDGKIPYLTELFREASKSEYIKDEYELNQIGSIRVNYSEAIYSAKFRIMHIINFNKKLPTIPSESLIDDLCKMGLRVFIDNVDSEHEFINSYLLNIFNKSFKIMSKTKTDTQIAENSFKLISSKKDIESVVILFATIFDHERFCNVINNMKESNLFMYDEIVCTAHNRYDDYFKRKYERIKRDIEYAFDDAEDIVDVLDAYHESVINLSSSVLQPILNAEYSAKMMDVIISTTQMSDKLEIDYYINNIKKIIYKFSSLGRMNPYFNHLINPSYFVTYYINKVNDTVFKDDKSFTDTLNKYMESLEEDFFVSNKEIKNYWLKRNKTYTN